MKNLIVVLALLLSSVCDADIYQWRDSRGNLHFSDRKPQEKTSSLEEINLDSVRDKSLLKELKREEGKRLLKSVSHGDFYQYIPKNIDEAFAIVVVNHGMFSSKEGAKEAAYNVSKRWQGFSEEVGAIIIAPVFDNFRYAVTTEGPQKWGYRGLFGREVGADEFLDEIISFYKKANRFYDGKIFLSGHSAGAQFANRYLVRHAERIHAAAFSAPAWFALPTYDFQWPNGMGKRYRVVRWEGELSDAVVDVRPDPTGWLKAAQLPITVVVGEMDLEKIRHVDGVGGDTHVDRAIYWVDMMNQYAKENGVEGRVKFKKVSGVGHNFGKLAAVCQNAMRSDIREYLLSETQRVNEHNKQSQKDSPKGSPLL